MKKNNWSKTLHVLSAVSGVLGLLMMVLAWFATNGRHMMRMNETHLFNDAQTFFMLAIWLGVATLIHMKIEKHSHSCGSESSCTTLGSCDCKDCDCK